MMTKKLYLLLLALLPLMGYCQVDKVYDTVEQMPSFPGGMSKLFDYLKKNVQYPAQEQAQLRGRVIVTFVVGKDGTIGDATVVKGLSPLIDAEAKRVVLAMPKWQPGRNNGSPVRVKYTIPLTFDSSNRAPARQDQQLASNTKQAGTAPVTEKKTESPVTEKKTETASSNLQKSVNGISKVFRFLMYKRKEMVERKENYCVYVISINDTKGTTPSITFASYEKQNPKIKKSETKVDLYGSVVFDFSTMDKDSTTGRWPRRWP